jgi:type IV pilus assembly protein PilN
MIRINLLGAPKPKKGKRSAVSVSMPTMEGGNIVVVTLVVVVLMVLVNGGWWMKLTRERDRISKELAAAQQENIRLTMVKAKYQEREKQKNDYQRRVEVIDQLRAGQAGPAILLTKLGETVNSTDAVWLHSMKEDGDKVNLEGMALSVNAVANFMQNLRKSGYFKSVEMKESFQDETVKDMQAFIFSLICEKQPGQKTTGDGKKS